MRTLCDSCESAAATVFCAADEAALCPACDDKVHLCNKLASRHVRVGLANPSDLSHCDICENAPAFFYCEVDGSSLCLQCDMMVHVGGKRTHKRYLLLRQKIEFPGDRAAGDPRKLTSGEHRQNHRESLVPVEEEDNGDGRGKSDTNMIDLNMNPQRAYEPASNNE